MSAWQYWGKDGPCYGCQTRTPGCACEAYKDWKALRFDAEKAGKQKAAIINDFRNKAFEKAVRRNGNRPRGQK